MAEKKKTENIIAAEVKAEVATEVKKEAVNETKTEAVIEAVKETAKEATAEKPVKKTATKKSPTKKTATKTKTTGTTTKSTRIKKTAAAPVETFKVQFGGDEYDVSEIKKAVENDYKRKFNGEVKSVDFYIKPEDKAVYYVINGDFSDKIEL